MYILYLRVLTEVCDLGHSYGKRASLFCFKQSFNMVKANKPNLNHINTTFFG